MWNESLKSQKWWKPWFALHFCEESPMGVWWWEKWAHWPHQKRLTWVAGRGLTGVRDMNLLVLAWTNQCWWIPFTSKGMPNILIQWAASCESHSILCHPWTIRFSQSLHHLLAITIPLESQEFLFPLKTHKFPCFLDSSQSLQENLSQLLAKSDF